MDFREGDYDSRAHSEDVRNEAMDNFRSDQSQIGTQNHPSMSPRHDRSPFADTAAAIADTHSGGEGHATSTEHGKTGALIKDDRQGFMKRGEDGQHRPLLQDGAGSPGPSYRVNHQSSYEEEEEEEEDEEDEDAEGDVYIKHRHPRHFLRRPHLAEDEQRLLPSTNSNTNTRSTNSNNSYPNSSSNTTATTNYFPSGPTYSDMSQSYAKGAPMKYPPLPLADPAPSSTAPSVISQADSEDALVKKNALADAGSTIALGHGDSSSAGQTHPPYPPPVVITMNTHDRPSRHANAIVGAPHDPHDEAKSCRICLDGLNESKLGRLISPCLCKGSSRYIHLKCLERWRELSPRKESFYRCDTCHYHYSFSRPRMAKLLDQVWFPHVATLLLMFFMLYGLGWVGKVLSDKNLWHWKETFRHGKEADSPPTNPTRIMGLDGPEYLFGLVWLAILGLVCWCVVLTYGAITDRSGGGCDCRGGGGGCYIIDCGNCGGDGEGLAIACLVMVVLVGIVGTFGGIYMIISELSAKAAANMKVTILEVR